MESPIAPEARTTAPRGLESERELQRQFNASLHPLLILVVLTLITSVACTVARLALVVDLNTHWHEGVPTLCQGAIAAVPYGSLDITTAFTFEAISNAIAVQTYHDNRMDTCHTPDYSLRFPNSKTHSVYVSLSAISAFDLFGTVVIHGLCWWRLFARCCRLDMFSCCLCWGLIVQGLDGLAVYEAHEGNRIRGSGMLVVSAVIL